jgi:membrane fusion protein (multidrug efflux system)
MANKWLKRTAIAALLGTAGIGLSLHFGGASAVGRIGKAEPEVTQGAPAPRELAAVEVTTVEPRAIAERLRVSGELQPVNRAIIKAKVSGTVLEVNARQGQTVEGGDVLVRFATDDLQSVLVQQDSNLDAARAQLVLAEQTLAKTQELATRGFATTAALEKAQSDVAGARASVQGLSAQTDTARTALGDAELVAPFDGIVASRSIEPGETANANTQLLTLVDISVLEAEVVVSTRDITRLAVGQQAELRVDGLEGQVVVGTVDRIAPVANDGTRFVPVHIRLENTDGRLWGGMFATGDIVVRESEDVIAVPETALRNDDAGAYVLKLVRGVLVHQAVEVGARWEGGRLVEIVSGLSASDIVLSAPLPELVADTAVVVSSAD